MGFFDGLGDLLGNIATDVMTNPEIHRGYGHADGLAGRPRKLYNLGRDNGSQGWQISKNCENAYNSGYDDGRYERSRQ